MDSILKNLVRVGVVSSINPTACAARVTFGDKADVVSYELPVLVRGSLQTKEYWMPVPGEQVLCVFLPSGNAQGFVLGSIYSQKDKPPAGAESKRCVVFSDGARVEYDTASHVMIISAVEKLFISAPKGVLISAPDITGDGVQITGKASSGGW